MLFGHLGEADDAVEGSAHVVRHVAEKGLLGLFALAGGGQGILQQLPLLQLAALFLLHLPEAEHPLPLGQDLVKEDLHVHPAVLLAEASEEVAAELPHPLDGELLEAGGGEAVQIFLAGVLLDDLAHHPCQVLVPAGRGQALLHVIRPLDDLIGVLEDIHPVEGITGIAQYRRSLIGPLHPCAEAQLTPGEETHAQQAEQKYQTENGRCLPQFPQDGVIGHGDQRGPAVGHGAVVDAALAAILIDDVGVIVLQFPLVDPVQEAGHIGLQLSSGTLQVGLGIDQIPRAVTQEKNGSFRQVQQIGFELELLGKNVQGQHTIGYPALLSHCDHRPLIHRIGIYIGENNLSVGFQRRLVPRGVESIVLFHPLPWIGGHDLAVHNGIGVHRPLPKHILQALKIHGDPALDILPACSLLDPPVDGLGAKGNEGLVDGEVIALLGGVALGQGRPGLLGVLQQLVPQDLIADSANDQKGQQHQEIGPHLSEDPLPAARPRLHPKASRMARQVSS